MSDEPTKLTARSRDGRGSRRPFPCRRGRPGRCPRAGPPRGTARRGAPARSGSRSLGLRMKALPGRDRDARHPQRDHRREVERGDAGADAERLAHRIDVDARAGALRIFALQDVRDAAAEFDDLEPALDVALGVGDHLAMLGRQQVRELVHVRFDQRLEVEHHARAALRVGHARLHGAGIGIVDIAEADRRRSRAVSEVIDLTAAQAGCALQLYGLEKAAKFLPRASRHRHR
jgi:hypothetical protein